MQKPLIGITMSREEKPPSGTRDWVRQVYMTAVITSGGIPVLLPNEPSSLDLVTHCHGLLLTGGGDFDPATYRADPQGTHINSVCAARDDTELGLINAADNLQMPIFGICRGMQALTIAGEGTLVQDLIEARPDSLLQHHQTQARMETTHAVSVNPNSHLAKVLSEPTVMVNSFHHQAVAKVPRGYNVAARADDGTIEAIEDPLAPFKIGVQWHPEDLASSQKAAKNLFDQFVEAARQYHDKVSGRIAR
ncbi:MAG: gamma-glutamyl-gamma-aminobutyrate hydrolase family protein [Sulfobacillus sp.]